jgi:3D (Asp-Asp-Asp) domain-containing protein
LKDVRLLARHVVACLLVVIVGLALVATPASAQEATPDTSGATHVVAGTGGAGLILRAGPGLDQAQLAVLPDGTNVRVLSGPTTSGGIDWLQIQVPGPGLLTGYSNAAYLVAKGQTQAAATTPAPATTPSPAAGPPPAGSRVINNAIVTGYAVGADGGAVGARTATGTIAHWGTVAADIRLYPFGTKLLIEGYEGTTFVVEDTGGAVQGDVFDVWFPDLASAQRLGTVRRQVTILPAGS